MTIRRYAAIVNPHSGRGRGLEILKVVAATFTSCGATLDVHTTTQAGHARAIARSLPLRDCEGACVIGGDGTVHEVVNGLMEREDPAALPIGIIPAGTGNDFARHLGVSAPSEAAKRILAGGIKPLDVARVTTAAGVEHCINIIGWGGAVDINRRAEKLRWLGPSRYSISALWQIVKPARHHARLTLDGRIQEGDFFLVVGCNTRFTGGGMKLAPAAKMDDGLIDVVIVRNATRSQMAAMFLKVFSGTHTSLECVEIQQVASFAIETDTRNLLNIDGELQSATPVRIEVIEAALRVFS